MFDKTLLLQLFKTRSLISEKNIYHFFRVTAPVEHVDISVMIVLEQ